MLHRQQYLPPAIRYLVHNLDAALIACEELLKPAASDPHNLLRLELTAITHVLQTREHMRELQFADNPISSQIVLFLAVTDCLEDSAPAKDQAASLEGAANRLIGGRIPVATLMALAAAMRDVLELCAAAIDEEAGPELDGSAPISEALVWATGADAN
jgi:hypothetical protein